MTIEFVDGEVIDARILHIDAEDRSDFTYDVLHVRRTGSNTDYSKLGACVAPIDMIKELRSQPTRPAATSSQGSPVWFIVDGSTLILFVFSPFSPHFEKN